MTTEPQITQLLRVSKANEQRLTRLVHMARQSEARDIARMHVERRARHPNPLARFGAQVYSQSDEDGIIAEILRRLDIESGTFLEFGVGNGTENNTLALLARGWRGTWVGGEDLAFDIPPGARLDFRKAWVAGDNLLSLTTADADVISMDLDGNDLHFCTQLLDAGHKPRLFICEYNAKFPPPIRFSVAYDPAHVWKQDDYAGASLQSLVDLFDEHDYALVCCNAATGANAFFVPKAARDAFADVPDDLRAIYADPFYQLIPAVGHPTSMRTITSFLR